MGVLHSQKRQLTARITDKLHIEASELKYQRMANIQLLVLERRKWRMESWASWSQQMQTPAPSLLLCSSCLCLSSFRQAQTCMMSAQRPTQAPQPLHLWLLASSRWPWKQSKAPNSGQLLLSEYMVIGEIWDNCKNRNNNNKIQINRATLKFSFLTS